MAAAEPGKEADSATEGALRSSHCSLQANVEEAYLSNLDKLSMGELKIQLVYLAAGMEERTKWEVVWLKEFLAIRQRERRLIS